MGLQLVLPLLLLPYGADAAAPMSNFVVMLADVRRQRARQSCSAYMYAEGCRILILHFLVLACCLCRRCPRACTPSRTWAGETGAALGRPRRTCQVVARLTWMLCRAVLALCGSSERTAATRSAAPPGPLCSQAAHQPAPASTTSTTIFCAEQVRAGPLTAARRASVGSTAWQTPPATRATSLVSTGSGEHCSRAITRAALGSK